MCVCGQITHASKHILICSLSYIWSSLSMVTNSICFMALLGFMKGSNSTILWAALINSQTRALLCWHSVNTNLILFHAQISRVYFENHCTNCWLLWQEDIPLSTCVCFNNQSHNSSPVSVFNTTCLGSCPVSLWYTNNVKRSKNPSNIIFLFIPARDYYHYYHCYYWFFFWLSN